MFTLAVIIGIYSYCIFALGIFGFLTKIPIFLLTAVWFLVLLYFEWTTLLIYLKRAANIRFNFKKIPRNLLLLFLLLFIFQAVVNLIGALGPELAFDALWYHLTLPKVWLLQHQIAYIPGGLLYYSVMPKLGETLYVGALAFGSEIPAKVIHFGFGILVSIALYKLSRKYFSSFIAILIMVIFYSNLVVDWESITAYIDLIRTFFEILALWSFLLWMEKEKWKWLLISAVMIGLAIATKVLAIESLLIFVILIFIANFKPKILNWKIFILHSLFFILTTLFIPFPWFIFSFIHTGNPVYPFFTMRYEIAPTQFTIVHFFTTYWNLFLHSADPISPLYLVFFPLIFITFPQMQKEIKIVVWYCILSLFIWYFTPQTGGGRFILPYLPAFSLVCGAIYFETLKRTGTEWKFIAKGLLVTIVFVSVISIGYRAVANIKYMPVIIGKESKGAFLTSHLNFSFGDFYDTDNYFAMHIQSKDTVLLYGFHNLYYVDFPFIDNSWVKSDDKFMYVATQNTRLPARFKNWQRIYLNDKTGVKLYINPDSKRNMY